MSNEAYTDRRLQFIESARHAFSYLSEYGFEEPVVSSPRAEGTEIGNFLAYRRQDWTVRIFYAWFPYEVSISMEYLGLRYDLYELMFAVDPEGAKATEVIRAATAEEFARGLDVLSGQLRKYAQAVLVGDPSIMTFLAEERARALSMPRRSWTDDREEGGPPSGPPGQRQRSIG